MTGRSRRSRLHTVLAVLAGVGAGVLNMGSAMAQQPSAADIQWAQTLLKDKHYDIGGRPKGQMTPQTKAALSQYQKANGLPVTGALDAATTSKMMAERSAKPVSGVGNLAQQKIGGGGPGQEPRLQHEIVPRAALRTNEVNNTGGGEVTLGPVVRGAPSQAPAIPSASSSHATTSRLVSPPQAVAQVASQMVSPAAPQAAAPVAAQRGAVTATAADGTVVPTTLLSKGEDSSAAPGWLRYVVMAVLGGTVGYLGLGWWRNGRATGGSSWVHDEEPYEERREPSFASSARPDELSTGSLPRFSSGIRSGR